LPPIHIGTFPCRNGLGSTVISWHWKNRPSWVTPDSVQSRRIKPRYSSVIAPRWLMETPAIAYSFGRIPSSPTPTPKVKRPPVK
jgi:hypothetical protein